MPFFLKKYDKSKIYLTEILHLCDDYILTSREKNKGLSGFFRDVDFSEDQIAVFEKLVKSIREAKGDEEVSKKAIVKAYSDIDHLKTRKSINDTIASITTGYDLLNKIYNAALKENIFYQLDPVKVAPAIDPLKRDFNEDPEAESRYGYSAVR